jgi:tetratricopeptide (TPR) repeat protein
MITIRGLRPVRPRPVALLGAVLLILGGSYLAVAIGTLRQPAPVAPQSAVSIAPLDVPAPAAGRFQALMARYDSAIKAWNASLQASSANYIAATNLGTVYVGRARLTGDLADYDRALTAAGLALKADPTYLPARELRATILFAVHDFTGARAAAQAILADAPDQLQALATFADASLELGEVEVARASYLELERKAASPPVWSRLSHLAFIEGDLNRAIGLVQRAIDGMADEPPSESTAFYSFQLGELDRARGNLDGAAAAYARALDDLPGYVPATAALARVREGQGHLADAITLLTQATDQIPQPEMVAALGDLHALAGDQAAADRAYALVDRIGAVARATGAVYNRQLVIFAADHDRNLPDALALARAEIAVRKDVYGHDALAWVLYKSGLLDEAAREATAALALGTPDPRIDYHAGLIAAAQGRTADARRLLTRALAGAAFLPPLQIPIARDALAALGGALVP